MNFDSLTLAAVRDELGKALVGGKVEKITQPDPLEVVLRIYHAGHKHDLLLSADPQEARAHLTLTRRENPPTPPAFRALLRRYLDGAWLDDVSMPLGFGERVLHLHFKAVDGAPYTLIAEIMGKHSNLIFVSGAGTILGAAKSVGRAVNRYREIRPGISYANPPRQRGKRDPFEPFTPEPGEPMSPDEAKDWLMQTWTGISPMLAQEVILRVPRGLLTPETLHHALTLLLTVVRVGDWMPRVWTDDAGVTQGAYPIALLTVPPRDQHPRESISLALDHASSSIIRRDTFARAKDSLLAALHRTRKLREREAQELEQGLKNAHRAEEYRQTGDLLLSHQTTIQKGQSLVSVADYYAPPLPDGEPTMRFIALDPTLNVHENAERFYKRSRKAESSAMTLKERRAHALEEVALIGQAERETVRAETPEEVVAIRTSMAESLARGHQQHAPAPGEAGRPAMPDYEGHKIKTFHTVDGWEILVGENAASNDYLTTKIAAPSDVWLHVRAATSAHGVIRAQNRPASISPAALQQAAEMVAARSEVKHSSLIPVDYTLKKYVRKPRKSAPGAVTYQNEKTLFVAGIHGE